MARKAAKQTDAITPVKKAAAPKEIMLEIAKLITDAGTQFRDRNEQAAKDFSETKAEKFPPVRVVTNGTLNWLWDGFHRLEAARHRNEKKIRALVTRGTLEDARWLACAANKDQLALHRTNEDKQRAVDAALRHPRAKEMSDRQIAEHVGVSNEMVGQWRKRLSGPDSQPTQRKGKDGRIINTKNIGKGKKSPAAKKSSAAAAATDDDRDAEPDTNADTSSASPSEQSQEKASDFEELLESLKSVENSLRRDEELVESAAEDWDDDEYEAVKTRLEGIRQSADTMLKAIDDAEEAEPESE